MTGLQILEKYPLSAKVVKGWFMRSMIESLEDTSVPEEFKEFMLKQGIEDEKVAKIIDVNVRILFDMFDENDVIIQIIPIKEDKVKYLSRVDQFETSYDFKRPYFTRKEAEHAAIEQAFEILEEQLTASSEEIIEQ
jgi:hypothetical protein